MKVGDLVDAETLPKFMRWYIEATRPLEDDCLAYCRKSYRSVPKRTVKELQVGRRLKQRKATKKKS